MSDENENKNQSGEEEKSTDESLRKQAEELGRVMAESYAKAINETQSEEKEPEEEETSPSSSFEAKVTSPYDALGMERTEAEKKIEKKYSPENIKRLRMRQQEGSYEAMEKTAAFFGAIYGMKAMPWDPKFYMAAKALSEGTDADGGFLVNPEFRGEVQRQLHHNGIMRPEVNVIPTNKDQVDFNAEDGRPQVSWGSENTSISTTTAGLSQTSITVHRLNSRMNLSREVVADSDPSIVEWIRQEFVDSIRNEEDAVIIGGSGSGRPKGLTQLSLTSYAAGTLDFTDYIRLEHTLPVQYRNTGNVKFYMNDNDVRDAKELKDSNNRPIFVQDLTSDQPLRLLGYPVVTHNQIPEGTAFFGDLRRTYILLDRQEMSVETTTEGSNAFDKHQVAMKVFERIGGDAVRTEALVKGTDFSA